MRQYGSAAGWVRSHDLREYHSSGAMPRPASGWKHSNRRATRLGFAMLEIALYIFDKVLAVLPRWIARWLLPPKRIAEQVEIDLRRTNPVTISLNAEVPNLDVWFRISNLSPVNLTLDRLLIELWVGQPTLRGAILDRLEIPTRSTREYINFWQALTMSQREQIRRQSDEKGILTVPVMVDVRAYFESRVGLVFVAKRLEHSK